MKPEEILRDLEAAKRLDEQSQHNIRKLITAVTDYASKMITEITRMPANHVKQRFHGYREYTEPPHCTYSRRR